MNIHEAKSWSDVMGVLIVQKLTSWVLWIFMKWPYGYFEYLWGDVIGILNNEVTLWKYSEADVMGILKFIFIFIFKTTLFWIFKIPMTSLQEYSKYNVTMNIQNIHVTYSKLHFFWILKIPITSRIFQNTHDVTFYSHEVTLSLMSNLNIRKLTPWVLWKFNNWSFEYSRSDVMVIHEVTSCGEVNRNLMNFQADVIGILNIKKLTSWVFWIFTKCRHENIQSWRHGYFEYSWSDVITMT